jgi:hypothetical protein
VTRVPDSRRDQLLLLVAVLLAAAPVIFGFVRAINTGDDFRYLWLAAAAILGSLVVMVPWHGAAGPARVSPGRAVAAVAAGAACAAAAAILQGATAGPGVAIVAVAFGLCTGTSVVLGDLARRRRSRDAQRAV